MSAVTQLEETATARILPVLTTLLQRVTRALTGDFRDPTRVRAFLVARLAAHPAWIDPLRVVLADSAIHAISLGVSEALNLLGGPPMTHLTDADLFTVMADRIAAATALGPTDSLLVNAIDALAQAIADEDLAGGLTTAMTQSTERAGRIGVTEVHWGVNVGRVAAYQHNDMHALVFRATGGACPICRGYDQQRYSVPPIIEIPVHPYCRCFWIPDFAGWAAPAAWWTGE